MKIREGNDFKLVWALMQDETTPRDMTGVFDEQAQLLWHKDAKEIQFTRIGNVLTFELTPTLCDRVGDYSIEYFFKQPDANFHSGYRNKAVDTSFVIVPCTAQADDVQVVNVQTVLA